MREMSADQITQAVAKCCIEANIFLPQDIKDALDKAMEREQGISLDILNQLKQNYSIAESEQMPVCQ
ncbi:MAG: fumarate hydratase, partial [Clostridia bacterium]|nr:fumarate hydratase [Clostridia bacterium]